MTKKTDDGELVDGEIIWTTAAVARTLGVNWSKAREIQPHLPVAWVEDGKPHYSRTAIAAYFDALGRRAAASRKSDD